MARTKISTWLVRRSTTGCTALKFFVRTIPRSVRVASTRLGRATASQGGGVWGGVGVMAEGAGDRDLLVLGSRTRFGQDGGVRARAEPSGA